MKLSGFFTSPPDPDRETETLIDEVKALRDGSILYSTDSGVDLASFIMEQVGEEQDATLGMRIGAPVARLIKRLEAAEPFAFEPPDAAGIRGLSASEGVALRKRLRSAKNMLEREDYFVNKWASAVGSVLGGMYEEFPEQAFVDPDAEGNFEEFSVLAPTAPLYTFITDVPKLIKRTTGTFFNHGLPDDGLFGWLRDQLLVRVCIASGIDPEDRHTTQKRMVLAEEKTGLTDEELIELYLGETPFYDLLMLPIPLRIPEAVRFEHTLILAGTGHGKTQALQFLIASDLEKAITEKRSVVVMDSQGDLLQTLMRSEYFRDKTLSDRFVYIDPTDIECPVGLNLFDIGLDGINQSSAVERETILNATIELYEYFFGGLLGAELTQKQGVVFRYLATLMTRIPNANIHTLRELMENGEPFRPYIKTLQGSARIFFETRFFDRQFSETKKQILNRLWGVLSNASLDRMMGATRNSVDLFNSLQAGSVVFINTAKDFLGHEGSNIFGRMFVALLGQALMRRAAVPRHERTATFIYVDEAEDVVDLTLVRMLAQIRKYKGAATFAHQNLDQFETSIRAGVITNTSIKLAGGVSAKDARALAEDMRCDTEFLLSQKKSKHETHFACFAKNVTDRAVTLAIPLGFLERKGRLTEAEYQSLLDGSRRRYGVPYEPDMLYDSPEEQPPRSVPPAAHVVAPFDTTVPSPSPGITPAMSLTPVESDSLPPAASSSWDDLGPMDVPPNVVAVLPPALAITHALATPAREKQRGMGQGGVKHKYLEHLIKELGEERGFRVTLEELIHDGIGRVDAVLVRGDVKLAFEISVTTTRDHELGNIEKCLASTYTHVVMLASHKKHQTSLERFISEALDDADKKRVSFLLPEDLPGFLDGYPVAQEPTERTVKGYTVRSRVKEIDPTEALARRKAIAQVVARSMQVST